MNMRQGKGFIGGRVSGGLTMAAVFALLTIVLYSCKREKDNFVFDYHYNYAPLDTGHYVIYDVDSVHYTFFGNTKTRDTARYQLMEIITDTFYDAGNQLKYRLELYRRENETAPWEFDRAWPVWRSNTGFRKKEDELEFIKLVFPPATGITWDGNAYIPTLTPFADFRDWEYEYESIHAPFSINQLSFDSSVSVLEVDASTAIQKKLRREVYAKNVGMVYQEWEILNTQYVGDSWDTGRVDGFRIRMKVHSHYP